EDPPTQWVGLLGSFLKRFVAASLGGALREQYERAIGPEDSLRLRALKVVGPIAFVDGSHVIVAINLHAAAGDMAATIQRNPHHRVFVLGHGITSSKPFRWLQVTHVSRLLGS